MRIGKAAIAERLTEGTCLIQCSLVVDLSNVSASRAVNLA